MTQPSAPDDGTVQVQYQMQDVIDNLTAMWSQQVAALTQQNAVLTAQVQSLARERQQLNAALAATVTPHTAIDQQPGQQEPQDPPHGA